MSWLDEAKAENFATVAGRLGMRNKKNRWTPCPACGQSRTSKDPRPIIHNYKGRLWTCNNCKQGGDTLDLVAYYLGGQPFVEMPDKRPVRDFFGSVEDTDRVTILRQGPTEYPPTDEVQRLLTSATRLDEYSRTDIDAWLMARAIDPAQATDAYLLSDSFDYGRLTYVTSSSGKSMPWWPSFWTQEYPVVFPLYDHMGLCKSFLGRTMQERTNQTKTRCPIGYNSRGLMLMNKAARQLANGAQYDEIWITEGEMDFLALNERTTNPVIGIRSGAVRSLHAIPIGGNPNLLICTDLDEAGDKYAREIAALFCDSLDVKRLKLKKKDGEKDVNDLIKDGWGVDDLRGACKPMDLSNIRSTRMLLKMIEFLETAQKMGRVDRQYWMDEIDINQLALAQDTFPHEIDEVMERIAAIHGCKGIIGKIETALRHHRVEAERSAQHVEAQELISRGEEFDGEDPSLEEMIYRKEIKKDGVVVGYGSILAREQNVVTILKHDRRWKGRMKYNEFSGSPEVDGVPWTDSKNFEIGLWLQEHYDGLRLENNRLEGSIDYVCRQSGYHPVRDKLKELYESTDLSEAPEHAKPEYLWSHYFGADDSPLHREYGKRFMIAAILRVMTPGCKVDAMPVLISRQGTGKSSGLRALAIEDQFFSDTKFDIRNKDAYQMLEGRWIYEIAEAEALLGAGFNTVKGFLTSQHDRYRKPYRRLIEEHPRSNVFCCTTNENSLEFLADPSGSRRYWSMMVGTKGQQAKVTLLKEERHYLWAWAYHYVVTEEDNRCWLTGEYEELCRAQNDKFAVTDTWADYIEGYLTDKLDNALKESFIFTIPQILEDVFRIDKDRQDMKMSKRVADIIQALGAENIGRKVVDGKRKRCWVIKDNTARW
tara:strand:- start:701 stop:3334 length:2634 start_codon:yes stop_codon:yes gene_type:complete